MGEWLWKSLEYQSHRKEWGGAQTPFNIMVVPANGMKIKL